MSAIRANSVEKEQTARCVESEDENTNNVDKPKGIGGGHIGDAALRGGRLRSRGSSGSYVHRSADHPGVAVSEECAIPDATAQSNFQTGPDNGTGLANGCPEDGGEAGKRAPEP